MLLEAHQPWSVSCYRREVKRLFQLLSYWLRPPSGQARPSVNPARNERRSLPTEKVSLWVYVMSSCSNPTNRKRCGWEDVCLSTCVECVWFFFVLFFCFFCAFSSLPCIWHFRSQNHFTRTYNLFPIFVIYPNQIPGMRVSTNYWEPQCCSAEHVALLPAS